MRNKCLICCCLFLISFLHQAEFSQRQREPCGGTIVSEKATVSSSNYPGFYGDNEDCTWTVIAPEESQIILRFKLFELERSFRCSEDYLEVFDGHNTSSPRFGKFCGSTSPGVITSSGNAMTLHFKTDYGGTGAGFGAVFKTNLSSASSNTSQLEPAICGGEIEGDNGTIHSTNYPENYEPLQDCTWKITVPENHLVDLWFQEVSVEHRLFLRRCEFDFVQILDGHDEDSPVLDTICDEIVLMNHYYSSTNKMSVKFVSDDSFERSGFSATFRKVAACGGRMTADRGVLQSPNDTNGFGFMCKWDIAVPKNYSVLLKFRQHEERSPYSPEFYTVDIRNEHAGRGYYIGRYSASDLPLNVVSNDNEINILVRDVEGLHGFYAEFQKVDKCEEEIVAENGVITSRNYPEEYYANEDCTWRISVPENYQVSLKFLSFHVKNREMDCSDYVIVRDVYENYEYRRRLGMYCGGYFPPPVRSTYNKLIITFVSNSRIQDQGFSAAFEKVVRCGGKIVSDRGVISSPNYPQNYSANTMCTWEITVTEGYRVLLEFKSFMVEGHSYCNYGAVRVVDGHGYDSPILGTFCGDTVPEAIRSSGNNMTVTFFSDVYDVAPGFTAEFQKELISYPEIESL